MSKVKRLVILPSLPPNMFYPKAFIVHGEPIVTEEKLKQILNEYSEIVNYNRHEPTNKYLLKLNDKITTVSGAYRYEPNDDILVVTLIGRTSKSGQDVEITGFNDLVVYLVRVEVK